MSTEVEIFQERDSWVPVMGDVVKLANLVATTEFVPKGVRGNAPAVLAAILAGREVGLPPMTAMAHIDVIEGVPTMDPEMMRALVLRDGHELAFPEMTASRCVVKGRRRGQSEWTTVAFTMDEAKRMNLAQKANWQKMPQAMLVARATSRICRLIFPDVIGGLSYMPEEIEAVPEAPVSAPDASPGPRTVQRKRTSTPVAPTAAAVVQASAVYAEGAVEDVPPLPEANEIVDAEIVPEPVGEPSADGITKDQLTKLNILLKELGFDGTQRRERLDYVAALVKRPLASSKELSKAEASYIIEAFQEEIEYRAQKAAAPDEEDDF